MLHTAIQSTISERYADDAWQKYGANNGTSSIDMDKYNITDKTAVLIYRQRVLLRQLAMTF